MCMNGKKQEIDLVDFLVKVKCGGWQQSGEEVEGRSN